MRTFVSRTKCFICRRGTSGAARPLVPRSPGSLRAGKATLRSPALLLRLLAAGNGDLLDHDVGDRLVARAPLDAGDLGDQRERIALAEDGVPAGEVLGRPLGDEELRAVGGGTGVGHGQESRLVELEIRRELVLETVARIAGPRSQRIAALDHESRDDPVEDEAVV